MRFIGIIPARYASTRFPGKPLAMLGDKPMIQRVYEQARKALDEVVVATDDERIYQAVEQFGGRSIMTRKDHKCGTDRCLEAFDRSASGVNKDDKDTVIINIQGDEPFIQPEQIEAIKACFPTEIATLVKPFTEADGLAALENPNTPKVVFSRETGNALLFSRSVIPYLRGIDRQDWLKQHKHYKHIGMYAYRADILREITRLPQTEAELAESLEQLRWLENGYQIRVAETNVQSIGIDTPEDLQKAIRFLEEMG
ncbi:MAG: 3-deoxy-manno-octulosonate cytidylyltransferase [Paludibacteraceae bacterium]|jgi:3-deoxy-manno-octulosonate cytidylyltransferase (CMP-KDO synthetase)|nr:3-deoxy-manno-octulosonate cytidylyltransferase [Paludibacteraceae bacterium]